MCKVTVVVPVYNGEAYLKECLDSILRQSLEDIEVICVNDGSTDNSPEILREFQQRDGRLRVIDQENAGYGHAINVGIREARGEYIGIVEADDYIAPRMYQKLWEVAHSGHLDLVKGDYSYFKDTQDGRVFDRVMICPYFRWYYKRFVPRESPGLLDADMMNVTGIYRRDFLLRYGIRLRETPGASFQDTGLWLQIFSHAGSGMFLPRSLYYIRRDNPASSVLRVDKLLAVCDEYGAAWDKLSLTPEKHVLFAPYLFKRSVFAYQFILARLDRDGQRRALARLAETICRAKREGVYDRALFSKPMACFLERVAHWDGGGEPPAYMRPVGPVKRFFACLKEHGSTYIFRRTRIKLGIQQEVF